MWCLGVGYRDEKREKKQENIGEKVLHPLKSGVVFSLKLALKRLLS